MDTGGKIRTGKLLENLTEIFDITLISNIENPKDNKYLDQVDRLCNDFHPVPRRKVKKYSAKFYLRLFLRTFSRYPVTVINDYSKDLESKILEVLENGEYDLLVCDFLQPSFNFRKITGHPTILFQHNVESVILRRHYETTRNPIAKLFWWLEWRKMDRYERAACQRFTAIVAVSQIDQKILEQNYSAKQAYTIPTGIDTEYFSPSGGSIEKNSLVFTGSMDWLPNEDAILFFAHEILGKVKGSIPNVKLTVVGRNPSPRLLNETKKCPEIQVVGRVEDVRPYINNHTLYIIPLRIGGGTRIKVYEAMAMGKAVVSTSVGTEGLPVEDGKHVFLADGAEPFAEAVIKLLIDTETRRRIEISGRDYVRKNFSWAKSAEVFADICWETVDMYQPT